MVYSFKFMTWLDRRCSFNFFFPWWHARATANSYRSPISPENSPPLGIGDISRATWKVALFSPRPLIVFLGDTCSSVSNELVLIFRNKSIVTRGGHDRTLLLLSPKWREMYVGGVISFHNLVIYCWFITRYLWAAYLHGFTFILLSSPSQR